MSGYRDRERDRERDWERDRDRDRHRDRDQDRDREWERDREDRQRRDREWDRDKGYSQRSEPIRPPKGPSASTSAFADERRDRDRMDSRTPRRPNIMRSPASNSNSNSNSNFNFGSGHLAIQSPSPKSPSGDRTLFKAPSDSTSSSKSLNALNDTISSQVKRMLDIICEREAAHREYREAQRTLKKMELKMEKLGANHPEFASEHHIWKSEHAGAKKLKTKSASRIQQLDQDAHDTFSTIMEGQQKQALTSDIFDARAKAMEAALEKRFTEGIERRLNKLSEEHSAEKAKLHSQLEEQTSKNQELQKWVKTLASKVEDLDKRLVTQEDGRDSHKDGDVDMDAPANSIVKEQVDKHEERLGTLSRAIEEHVEMRERHATEMATLRQTVEAQQHQLETASEESKVQKDVAEPLHQKVTELEQNLETFKRRVKEMEERTPSRQESPAVANLTNNPNSGSLETKFSIYQDMVMKSIGSAAHLDSRVDKIDTAIQNIKDQMRHFQGQEGVQSRGSASPDMSIPDSKLRQLEEGMIQKFSKLAERSGTLIDGERKERLALAADLQTKLEKVGTSLDENDKNTTQTLTTHETALKEIQYRLHTKVHDDAKILEDIVSRINFLNTWKENFNSSDIAAQMVTEINNAIPRGTQLQLNKMRERLSTVEGLMAADRPENLKRRRTDIGDAIVVNGHA